MGSFGTIQNYIGRSTGAPEQVINIEEAFTLSPKTPVSETQVAKMDVFDETVLRDCIISNILIQHQNHQGGLLRSTWFKLLEFLGKDFNNGSVTIKIYIQALVHFSKMFIDADTSKNYGVPGKGEMEFYDIMLNNFLDGALGDVTADIMIKGMTMEKVTGLKQRLLSQPILKAILKSLSALELPSTLQPIDINYISNKISSGSIYETTFFSPFQFLRGASLQDGILICSNNIAGHPSTLTHNADLLTLAAHEFSHHIARLIFNDLNFSSPWKNRESSEPRFDFGTTPQLLEIGRNTELVLFGGIQPNWYLSGNEAATTFLDRIDSNFSSLPIILKDERIKLNLNERHPTSFLGFDIKPGMIWME